MKNKGVTYALLVVVGVIWYQVFMRVKTNLEADTSVPAPPGQSAINRRIAKPETFRLNANYRDPFTGNLSGGTTPATPSNDPVQPPTTQPPQPKPEPVVVQWPSIRYYGLVRKTTSNEPRTLLAIDGSIYKIRQGEQLLDNIMIVKVTRDYVRIRYKKEERTYQKSVR